MPDTVTIEAILRTFEAEYGYRVVYVTQYGSKLFGTDTPRSDTDYKGVFIPKQRDVLLKRDIDHYTYSSNESVQRNTEVDVDLQLFSIYKWFALLKKGETGAIDLLFSLFREETQVYSDPVFTRRIMDNYARFYNRHLHSFVGYCIGQSKIYNIKGERFHELHDLVGALGKIETSRHTEKLETLLVELETLMATKAYRYIRFVTAPSARGSGTPVEDTYVEVLGKKFYKKVTVGYFLEKITQMEAQFGNRSRASAQGVDYKALSHAVRVISEVEELIDDGFITFPLKNRVYVKSIKEGQESLESVMAFLDRKLTEVQGKLEASTLPEHSDEAFIEALTLELVV